MSYTLMMIPYIVIDADTLVQIDTVFIINLRCALTHNIHTIFCQIQIVTIPPKYKAFNESFHIPGIFVKRMNATENSYRTTKNEHFYELNYFLNDFVMDYVLNFVMVIHFLNDGIHFLVQQRRYDQGWKVINDLW